ncbi:MAG TPA: OmpA family protein [Cyclobacteriaceae bacterium]|nr:OmpA family protein [Cyclobacteriaceae bacterium]
MRKFRIIIVLVAALITARAQTPGEIWIEGKVLDVGTGKGVKANIHYKSLPTGGINGSFKDSVYRFSIFGSSKYEVSADVDGYITAVAIVDPKKGVEGKILRNLTLTPKGQTIRLSHLIFEQGKSVIDPASFDELDEVAQMLIDHSKLVIQLEGHTDNQGSISKNMELSQDRVDEVKDYLVDKGVGKSRVKTKAFGGTKPLSNEKTVEARNLNRRVEIRILSE